jgi:pimeloyl-ACP methyl ester carboxylesterase
LKTELYFEFVKTNGITLHVARAGNQNDPLVVLLHGFPEYWGGWQHQFDEFVAAGFQVVAPDQRGYNLSSKPWRIGSYKLDKLAADIVGLIDHFGKDKAYIVGHDFGAVVAWVMALTYPDRLHKLVTINVPHPSTMKKFLKTDDEQRKKSRYMLYFQLPWLPQFSLKRRNFKRLTATLVKTSNHGTFSDQILEGYKEAWTQRRAVPCMLNWYRAMVRRRFKFETKQVKIPNLIVWGENDRFLKKEMGEESLKYCDNGSIEIIKDTTHWVHHEKPEIINPLILEFLKSV